MMANSKDENAGPSTPKADEKGGLHPVKKFKVDRLCSPNRDASLLVHDMASPMSKYHTPQKSRAEIASLKSEVDELRSQLREESVRKKAVLKDIEQQTRQLQASEARLRVMETKLKELAQSKHALSLEKASSDKELHNLKVKWDAVSKKLDKIHDVVARSRQQITSLDKEKSHAEHKSSILTAELSRESEKKKSLEAKCIELTEKLALSHRQVEQLTQQVQDSKRAQEDMLDKEETQSQLYSLACTISNLRADLEAEMNYSSQRKTELALAIAEKERIESLLADSRANYESSLASWHTEREQLGQKASSNESQLEALKSEHLRFKDSHTEQLERLKDVITSLNEEIALRDANMIESEGAYRDLERAFENLTNERDSKLREIELLGEEVKAKQLENRRLDERVNFLESAMDYLRSEMSEKLAELDDLKAASAQLHEQLTQKSADLHSAQQSQAALQDSLDKANEKIEELENLLVEVKYEKLALAQNMEASESSYSVENAGLLQELTDARAAQDIAKADLEDLKVELEAGRAALSNHMDLLAHKEAIHAALVSAHDALLEKQKSLDNSLNALRAQNTSLTSDLAQKDVELAQKNDSIRETEEKFGVEAQELKLRISSLNEELASSLASIEEQKLLVSRLQTEVESLRQSKAYGEQKISELEKALSLSSAEVSSLTAQNNTLTTEVTSLNTEVTALSANVETLKKELNLALESAFDLMNSKSDLAQEHAERETQHLDAQKNYINQISELQSSLRAQRDNADSIRSDLEKKLSIIEECYNGKLETTSHKHQREMEEAQNDFAHQLEKFESLLAERSGVVASKVEQLEKAEERLAKAEEEVQNFVSQVGRMESQLLDKNAKMDEMKAEFEVEKAEYAAGVAQMESQIAKLKSDSDSNAQVHYDQMSSLHASVTELKKELAAMEGSKSVEVEEMRAKYLSVSSTLAAARDRISALEKDKCDLEESELELRKALIAETEAKSALETELKSKSEEVADCLAKARSLEEQLSEVHVERRGLQVSLSKVEGELAKYKSEMSETDAVLALSQAECDDLKKEKEKMKAERTQWMALAEQQKSEMEHSFRLLKDAQDEVEAVTTRFDQLTAKYEKLKTEKAEEEKAENDLRVKKLSHEVRMMTAELTRYKSRVTTRDTAIQAGKAREEKLQGNLDAQIEKCRDLQRQLADKDRETIIERGRAKSVGHKEKEGSKPLRLRTDESSDLSDVPTIDEYHDLVAQLASAKSELTKLHKQLEVEKTQIETLISEQTKLTGHYNPKQKIQFTHKLMTENHELKLERANLLAQLEKKGFDSPHRKSLTRTIGAKVRPTCITTPNGSSTATASLVAGKDVENFDHASVSLTSSAPLTQKMFSTGLNASIDAENAENINN